MKLLSLIRGRLFVGIAQTIIKSLPSDGSRILDLGCGKSDLSSGFAGFNIYGLDIDRRVFDARHSGKIAVGDANNLPFKKGSFEAVVIILLLHSITEDNRHDALKEIKRVSKDGGRIIILDFCRTNKLTSKWFGAIMDLEERFCGKVHYDNYLNFLECGGIEGFLADNFVHYKLIKKYRFGNLALLEVGLKETDIKQNGGC